MTALYLFDAAFSDEAQQKAVKAAGGIAMSCYLTGDHGKSSPQPASLHALGLGALGNWERLPAELITDGKSTGSTVGSQAAVAWHGKGAPVNVGLGIAFSVDTSVPASKFAAVGETFEGILAGVAGRYAVLVYGEGALIDYLVAHHDVAKAADWLSASASFPGYNVADPNVGLAQQVGSPVSGTDRDLITDIAGLAPFIWWPAGSKYATEDDPMADLTAAQLTQIADAVFDKIFRTDGVLTAPTATAADDAAAKANPFWIFATHVEAQTNGARAAAALAADIDTRVAAVEKAVSELPAALTAAIEAASVRVAKTSIPATLTIGS